MPDNPSGERDPDEVAGGGVGVATEEPDDGQSPPRASADDASQTEGAKDKVVEATPEEPWRELGFESAGELAKSHKELRSKFNQRDKEVNAARTVKEELDRLQSAIGLKEDPSQPAAPAPSPLKPEQNQDADGSDLQKMRDYLGEDAATYISRMQEELKTLKGEVHRDKEVAIESSQKNLKAVIESEITGLIEEVGEEEYRRVMQDPKYTEFVANELLNNRVPVRYVFAGLDGVMADARAKKSGTEQTVKSTEGGPLPPGGRAGGGNPDSGKELTAEETAYKEMREYHTEEGGGDFWDRGKQK